jgi:hypothetical protein
MDDERTYYFDWTGACAPRVRYVGGLDDRAYEDLAESAAELDYSIDWTNQVRLSPAFQPDSAGECWYAAPLVWIGQ